jgi:hypothetical protein
VETVKIIVDTKELNAWTQKLKEMNRYSFPVAIRQTLSKVAFDVKTTTMPKQTQRVFENRRQNFFKANSRVEPAKGLNINAMMSQVGFISTGLHNSSTNYSIEDLKQQEYGGKIGGRAFIPMKNARVGFKGVVRANYRMEQLEDKEFINAKNVRSLSGHGATNMTARVRKQKLIRAAIMAKRLNNSSAYVLGNPNASGAQTLFKVSSLSIGRRFNMRLIPLYTYQPGRKVNVSRTNFMKVSSLQSQKKMEEIYKKEAFNQIAKHINK